LLYCSAAALTLKIDVGSQFWGFGVMPKVMENAKIACVDFNLNKYRLQMGVQVLVQDPENLDMIRQREMDICKERC
jgi:chaperonin GroEL (HSP60 family)